ncbi:hypothetical protein [Paludisphaera rhizosphaerae]|uniref:hypothetical protein n=1 Tax=Paludisphaera rhizosphaerae TaxID=2711216 RepID=UPI0013EA1895|nr:hypothetical protein [Paludisphaera rhizosphaerae]
MPQPLPRTIGLPSAARPALAEAPPLNSVAEAVQELMERLAELKPLKNSRPQGRTVRRYRDSEFSYMEVVLPGLEGIEADICIHDGCVFVRVAR